MKKIISLALAAVMLTSIVAIPTQAADFLTDKVAGRIPQDFWTAREVPEGTVVESKPDYSADPMVETSIVKGGGFEYTNGWSDELNTLMFWQDGNSEVGWTPWTFSTDVKLEGKQSGCVDVSTAMAALSGSDRLPIMGFQGVYLEPCMDNQVYRMRFYTKVDKPLGMENPQIMIYMLDTSQTGLLDKVVGTSNVMIDSSNIDYHWYDQNQVIFEGGQNPNGEFNQGYGPFAQGKWVQIDAYFQTPSDFNESAFTLQIQTNSGADCKVYFDAISLEKISMDEVDMGIPLKTAEETTSIKFKKSKMTVKRGKKITLKVTLKGAKKATFSVDKKGKKVVKLSKKKAKQVTVTGKKKGKATITAKASGKKATCKVTVK